MERLSFWLALAVLAAGCNERPPVKSVRQPDGTWRIHCNASLALCADGAESVCKDRGLTLLSGRSEHKLYGHESGVSQVEARSSELIVRCVERKGGSPDEMADAPPPVLARADAAPLDARACVPGATQRCIGPGACSGGQACLSDGSAFGACDCGGAPQPPAAVAPASSSAAPANAAPAPAAPPPAR